MTSFRRSSLWAALLAVMVAPRAGRCQDTTAVRQIRDSLRIRFVDTDLRAVIQALGHYMSKPVIATNVPGVKVSLETPEMIPRSTVGSLLRGLVQTNGLELTEESTFVRVAPPPPAPAAASVPATSAQSKQAATVQLFVVRLKHARASDVAATINQLFGGGGEFAGRGGGLSTGTLGDELRRNNVAPQGAAGDAAARSTGGHTASLTGSVVIVPDELTNSLLVRANEGDFHVMKEAVDQLDIRPLQVLIEVLIVEVRHDRSFDFGADLTLAATDVGKGASVQGATQGGGLGDLAIHVMGLAHGKLDAILRLAESKGDVEIVSRPVLLASNNTEARFLVGSQRPFVQVSRSLPTDTPSRDQVVQYRDVGTKLTVRPTINQDGYVSLVLQQEINAATSETQFDAPIISTREAATQVLVRDGQTIVLGGLRDRQRDQSRSGIPVLSSIPILGGLFGSTSRRSSSTELFLFVTPRIIRTDADADSLTVPRLPLKLGL